MKPETIVLIATLCRALDDAGTALRNARALLRVAEKELETAKERYIKAEDAEEAAYQNFMQVRRSLENTMIEGA